MKLFSSLKPLLIVIFCFLLPLKTAFGEGYLRLSGAWFHDGQPVSIQKQFGHSFLFCNEQNDCANGFINFPGNITVPQWNVTGNIQGYGNMIYWSNNTVWSRNNFYPPFDPMMLNGQWTHNGRTTFVSIGPDGQVTITNEWNQTSQGYISGNRRIMIPSQGLQGVVDLRQNVIRWSNNTVWVR